jgi:hypothetical protein
LELDQITEIIKTFTKNAYDKGFDDGSTKQAILELRGRDRFLEDLKAQWKAAREVRENADKSGG